MPTVLTCFVGLQLRPPSTDLDSATCSLPVKRLSCHTTYRDPVTLSTAISGIKSPVRTPWPSSGSVTPAGNMRSITIGLDQVLPLSVERITSAVKPRFLTSLVFLIRLNTITRWPFGSTTIWLPIV